MINKIKKFVKDINSEDINFEIINIRDVCYGKIKDYIVTVKITFKTIINKKIYYNFEVVRLNKKDKINILNRIKYDLYECIINESKISKIGSDLYDNN